MAYTPQLNGRVKRKHRHLLDTVRALRSHANLPIRFCEHGILTATYLINKMPVNVLDRTLPFEKLHVKMRDGIQAMNAELKALEKNETWSLATLPPGHKPISSKWVYKTKYKPTGLVKRLKAKLVVRGFNQKEGLDDKDTFSPVTKLATMRVLIALATAKEWPLH
nr:retrovirus-related Pol polyprotein from transposon TNT 1-94 [Tanacetum cinerariifolium]